MANNKEKEASVLALSNIEHVYEEVKMIKKPRNNLNEHDIRDYYEKYSPATAKTLIDTLFLPRHAICRECAKMKSSPVYTDRLIYMKESLLAIEVVLCQRDDVSCFKYSHKDSNDIFYSHDRNQDCMLVYSYVKTNSAGIFYSHCWPQDIFDLQSLLKPSIHVINRTYCNPIVNTQLYHRYINNYHVRISKVGYTPMIFCRERNILIDCTRNISHNNDSQEPMIYQKRSRESHIDERRGNRSSLLLLEPLLLMPELAVSEHQENTKNRVLRSERIKIIRIILAYVLSFLILTSITFYIVYFT
ncbi:hypothetical protein P5V15_011244 [Pogonomyrmex californicus]